MRYRRLASQDDVTMARTESQPLHLQGTCFLYAHTLSEAPQIAVLTLVYAFGLSNFSGHELHSGGKIIPRDEPGKYLQKLPRLASMVLIFLSTVSIMSLSSSNSSLGRKRPSL